MDNERIDEILSSAMENPDQAILDLMPLVSSTLNSWLKTRPSLIYLKDDMPVSYTQLTLPTIYSV